MFKQLALHMKPVLLIGLLAGASAFAHAEIHKWVDENGQVTYSQTAPPSANAQEIKPPPPPASDPEDAQAALQEQIDRLDKAREARRTDRAKHVAAEKQKTADDEACAEAREYSAKLESRSQVLLTEADGSTRRLSEEELETMREEARNRVNELCGGN